MFLDRKLEVFMNVAELGSFSRAGRRLELSQSSVSFHILTLEKSLGVKLFRRKGRRIELTEEGKRLYQEGLDLAAHARRVRHSVAEYSESVSRIVHIGSDALTCSFVFPWASVNFCKDNPDVEIYLEHISQDERIEKIVGGELDILLTSSPIRHRFLQSQVCFRDDVILLAAPTVKRDHITPKELKQCPMVWCTMDQGLDMRLAQALKKIHINTGDLRIAMSVQDVSLVKTAAEAGIGFTFLPRVAVRQSLQLGTLKEITLEGFHFEYTTHIVGHKKSTRPVVKAFWDYARSCREEAEQKGVEVLMRPGTPI